MIVLHIGLPFPFPKAFLVA